MINSNISTPKRNRAKRNFITNGSVVLINSFDELITHYQVGKPTRNSVQRDNPFETRLSDKLTNFVSNIVAFFVSQKRVKAIPTFISVAKKTCVAFTYENNPMTNLLEKLLGYFFLLLTQKY